MIKVGILDKSDDLRPFIQGLINVGHFNAVILKFDDTDSCLKYLTEDRVDILICNLKSKFFLGEIDSLVASKNISYLKVWAIENFFEKLLLSTIQKQKIYAGRRVSDKILNFVSKFAKL